MMVAHESTGAGYADLVAFLTTDFLGITRGRSVPRAAYDAGEVTSCGWVPANTAITPFDLIADRAPFGSRGDLRLLPDRNARFRTVPDA